MLVFIMVRILFEGQLWLEKIKRKRSRGTKWIVAKLDIVQVEEKERIWKAKLRE